MPKLLLDGTLQKVDDNTVSFQTQVQININEIQQKLDYLITKRTQAIASFDDQIAELQSVIDQSTALGVLATSQVSSVKSIDTNIKQ